MCNLVFITISDLFLSRCQDISINYFVQIYCVYILQYAFMNLKIRMNLKAQIEYLLYLEGETWVCMTFCSEI